MCNDYYVVIVLTGEHMPGSGPATDKGEPPCTKRATGYPRPNCAMSPGGRAGTATRKEPASSSPACPAERSRSGTPGTPTAPHSSTRPPRWTPSSVAPRMGSSTTCSPEQPRNDQGAVPPGHGGTAPCCAGPGNDR